MTPRVAVLVSGSGTNLQALLDAQGRGELGADIALVISNRPGVKALERAAAAGVTHAVIEHKSYASREDFDAALRDRVRASGATLVVLAGFMRVLTRVFLDAFPDAVLNVHPALLPSFPGVDAQAQALAYGVKLTGCTVHLVDAGVDTGPIVSQSAVEVRDDDTVDTLRARVLAEEHRLLPAAVRDLAAGRLRREGRRVVRVAP
ncbi:MAG: phosphoribosylglycinamide formyltransferase [Polyangiales bacterium]